MAFDVPAMPNHTHQTLAAVVDRTGSQVNPASEGKLQQILDALGVIDAQQIGLLIAAVNELALLLKSGSGDGFDDTIDALKAAVALLKDKVVLNSTASADLTAAVAALDAAVDDLLAGVEANTAALAVLTGDGLTPGITNDVIVGAGSGVIVAAAEGVPARLHALTVVMDGDGTVGVYDSDDAALFGPFVFAEGAGIDRSGAINLLNVIAAGAAGKGLKITTTGSGCHFHAVYSTQGGA